MNKYSKVLLFATPLVASLAGCAEFSEQQAEQAERAIVADGFNEGHMELNPDHYLQATGSLVLGACIFEDVKAQITYDDDSTDVIDLGPYSSELGAGDGVVYVVDFADAGELDRKLSTLVPDLNC